MKKFIKYFSILLCLFACKSEEGNDFVIYNNTDQTILAYYTRFEYQPHCACAAEDVLSEYKNCIGTYGIGKNSSKNFEGIKRLLLADSPYNIIYIYIYNRADSDNMSCEEFKEKDPVLKKYTITKEDAEEMGWTLVYP